MKKLTFTRLGAVAAFVFVVPLASAQEHKNQAFLPSSADAATPTSSTAVASVTVGGADTDAAATKGHDFSVHVSDLNFRQMIARWAKESGWNSEWAVEGDINVAGEYTWHDTDFVNAVRSTLHTTEGGETPVHGCYYSNNWVRVVPLTTQCTKR
ncbi:TcpQ domain-containing protein [Paraburkholderia humisilvae]|uniref:Toxin co-regulated pilus biosynthesis protein Q C-terminal domain-containing protein n=1 Tax=Paraburkholderia humisilvae TaxID=627669 RepID=A0A6J5ENW4_9BURK|nr:TcpQ domain-containing protein [Paraburkholderia humisilvae]CAB3767554.1 hypothetical protein LMG29542_05647 [Paraburkholderia humisilvae]